MNFFDRANQWINNIENSLVNLLSAIAPWLAPVVPMQIAVQHMIGYLSFSKPVAWMTGAVVEILGLAAVSTILRLWRHNQNARAEKNRQPIWVPIFVYGFYLTIILSVIALPELAKTERDWIAVTVKILLSLLSVPAAITLAIRAQNTEIVQEMTAQKAPRPARTAETNQTEVAGKLPNLPPKVAASDWRNLPHEDRLLIKTMTTAEIMAAYDLPERTARNWRNKALQNGQVQHG